VRNENVFQSRAMTEVLRAPFALEYTYTRSVGPVLGAFFAGLRDGKVLGARTASGRVLVPPSEYDPETSEAVTAEDLVEVASEGVITTWTWVSQPRARQPLDHPFAWALVRLDGADTAILHAVDAPDESALHTGQRVRFRWAAERKGFITDIACFEPA
jgi:uncharacterized OB-fold protein